MAEIISKLLLTAIWNGCANILESIADTLCLQSLLILTWSLAQDSIWNMQICSYALFSSALPSLRDHSMNDQKIEQSDEHCFIL